MSQFVQSGTPSPLENVTTMGMTPTQVRVGATPYGMGLLLEQTAPQSIVVVGAVGGAFDRSVSCARLTALGNNH